MSGIPSTGAPQVGTNLPPISFPGISSGIDYNSIIQKLTALTLIPVQQYNNQIAQVNAKNAELIKINGLLSSVQGALTQLSNPQTFSSFTGISSNSAVATAVGNGTQAASPGSYTLTSTQLATASSITATVSSAVGHRLSDVIAGDTINPANNGLAGNAVPLAEAYTAITPTNGGPQRGQITIDGVAITYDVASDSVNTIISRINTAVQAVDGAFVASYDPVADKVTLKSTAKPISLGSPSDRGNLSTLLKLDVAQVVNTPGSGQIVSAGPIGGVNQGAQLNNGYAANFRTAVTSGYFTINGVTINVDVTKDNTASVLSRINASAAGVNATYDTVNNQIVLTSKTTGPSGIVVGGTATGDTSNFLDVAGLTAARGATATIGTQAAVTVQKPSGATQTYYSNTNAITTAIPGLTLNIFQNSATPTTITVTQDSTPAISAINTFVSAYNAVINEINIATAVPVVKQQNSATASSTTSSSQQVAGGGSLYGDLTIESIKNRLVQYVTSIVHNGNSSYQSLSSIGLQLDNSHQVLQASTPGQTPGTPGQQVVGPITVTTASGTSGQFLPLNVQTFQAAFAAQPGAISSIFNGSQGVVTLIGSYLTTVTGLPTSLSTGLAGKIPTVSILQNDENANSSQITSLQAYVKQLQDKANAQADSLRKQFTATEGLLSKYQSIQSSLGQLNQKFN